MRLVNGRSSVEQGCDVNGERGDRLPLSLVKTIVAAAAVLKDAHDRWRIISGAAAAIHRAYPITVADVMCY